MKAKQVLILALLALSTLNSAFSTAEAQGTAFTYQGQLSANGGPANGNYDFTFALFNTNSTNTGQVGATLTDLDVGVSNGLFIVRLDFGANFPGASRWLSIGVRTNGAANFTALNPLQELTPTPYAIYTPNAGNAATATSATSASTAATASNVANGIAITNAVITNSVFDGNGGGLTNLNASQLTSIGNTNPPAIGNFFVGLAGNATTLGQYNTVIGQGSLQANTTGNDNTAVGSAALQTNTTGMANTAFGFVALRYNSTGSENTAIGSGALSDLGNANNAGGTYNIALGYNAGSAYTANESSNIDIGNVGSPGENNIIRIGSNQTTAYIAGVITGNGGGLTSLNASQLSNGVVPTNVLPGFQSPNYETVGGGQNNTASAEYAAVGGGSGNVADNAYAVVGGGFDNTASYQSTVGGGGENNATGFYATIPGGNANLASGNYSFATGDQAQATNQGAFVWADSQGTPFASTTTNQFNVRANGGARFVTGGAGMTLDGNAVLTNNESGLTLSGAFSGNGGGLINLNASKLTSIGLASDFFLGSAGNATTSGNYNTAIGVEALQANTIGYQNTANGYEVLYANTIGTDNTASGNEALYANESGSYNTADGNGALYANTNGFQNTGVGAGALYNNESGFQNTAIGDGALASLGLNNSAGGSNNVALGYQAGYNFTKSESSNIDIGNPGVANENNTIRLGNSQSQTYIAGVINGNGGGLINLNASKLTSIGLASDFFLGSAGNATTSGNYNTAIGVEALQANTIGYQNTANGYEVLYANTIGTDNTASGNEALYANESGSYNTADGNGALYANTNGFQNTGVGAGALYNNESGFQNTAIGDGALASLGLNNSAGGSNNVALGYQAGYNFTKSESSNIDIGNPGVANENNTIRIGTNQTATYIAGISGATAASGVEVFVNSSGQLGTATSSARFKKDIQSMDDASDVLLALHPVKFKYKPELDPQGLPQFGLVAEEVDKVDPDLVARDDKGKINTVRYNAVNAMLLNEFLKQHRKVQEQSDKLQSQDAEIQALQQKNDSLATRLNELEATVKLLADRK